MIYIGDREYLMYLVFPYHMQTFKKNDFYIFLLILKYYKIFFLKIPLKKGNKSHIKIVSRTLQMLEKTVYNLMHLWNTTLTVKILQIFVTLKFIATLVNQL